MKKVNIKIADLELRSCNNQLTQSGSHTTLEIVQWKFNSKEEHFCITVANWIKGDEYNLKFVDSRPFSTHKDTFWRLASIGQQLLEGKV